MFVLDNRFIKKTNSYREEGSRHSGKATMGRRRQQRTYNTIHGVQTGRSMKRRRRGCQLWTTDLKNSERGIHDTTIHEKTSWGEVKGDISRNRHHDRGCEYRTVRCKADIGWTLARRGIRAKGGLRYHAMKQVWSAAIHCGKEQGPKRKCQPFMGAQWSGVRVTCLVRLKKSSTWRLIPPAPKVWHGFVHVEMTWPPSEVV